MTPVLVVKEVQVVPSRQGISVLCLVILQEGSWVLDKVVEASCSTGAHDCLEWFQNPVMGVAMFLGI